MTPKPIKLRMARGDTSGWPFAVRDANGNPQTLVGATASFTARLRAVDATATFTKTIGAGITVTDAAGGLLIVRLAEADTSALVPPVTLVWDLQVVDAAGNKLTVAEGYLYVRQDVSRP